MKILHVINSMEIGGAQKLLLDLLPLQAKTEDVSLLVYERVNNDFEKAILQAGIKVICLNQPVYHSPAVVTGMRRIFRDYDVVHVHLFPSVYWASLASIGMKVKMVYTEHSTSNRRRGKWYFRIIERFVYGRYDRIISISPQTQYALQGWLGQSGNRFVVINNAVDIRRFSAINRPTIPKSLTMVSRFAPAKDQETVIRAMGLIDDQEVVLRLVGDGSNMDHCKEVAKECGVEDRVLFLGARSDVPELVAESYIGIQSSCWEGFGLTAVEFMAAGKPIVASRVPGLEQVVEGAGLLFEKGSETELAAIINRLLSNKEEYDRVSERCKLRASKYDIREMSEAYIDVYKTLIAGS